MTPPPPPSAAEYDTTAEATAAAPTEPQPSPPTSAEDPHDECVLCCYPHPLKEKESRYKACCGELICNGCIIAQKRTLIIGTNVKKPIKGSKEEQLEFTTILCSKQIMVCPFCRAKEPTNSKEHLKRLWEQIDEYNDPKAMNILGVDYMKGNHGLSKNLKKAEELQQRSYNLGYSKAAFTLSVLHRDHVPDAARMMKYLEEGVRRGHGPCMNAVGVLAHQSGNTEEAKRQFMTAARSGNNEAAHNLMVNYRSPGSVVSKDDLATTLRAQKAFNDKRKTEPREYAKRHRAFEEKMV